MPDLTGLLIVVAVAFACPFVLGLFPRVRLPSVVLEILAGILIGPAVLGIVEVDQAIEVLSVIGLAFLLFLAGLEVEFDRLRGPMLRLPAIGFVLSFAIAVVVALALSAGGLVETPLLVAIILCATSLGVIIPVLKDAGEISSTFGQLVVAAGSIADFGAIILLSLFFSGEGGIGATLLLHRQPARARDRRLRRACAAPSCPRRSARTCSGCRTRRRRSGCAARSCCSSGSARSPTSSASR